MMEIMFCVGIVGYLFVFNHSALNGISVYNFILNLLVLICLKHLLSETLEYTIINIFSPYKLLKNGFMLMQYQRYMMSCYYYVKRKKGGW